MTDSRSNLRPAPRDLSPLLVERLLGIFERIDAPAPPRIRMGAPSESPRVVPIGRGAPLQNVSAAIAYLRGQRVSVSVAESSPFGTRWWVSGYPDAFDAAAIVAVARTKGFR